MIADIDATEGTEGAARNSQTPVTPRTEKISRQLLPVSRERFDSLFREETFS
jgi:hypothetical protein